MSYKTNIIKNNKGKVMELEIDIGLRNDIVRFIRDRIVENLEATKRLLELKEQKYDQTCAGIYTYAVEEYGKILFLNNLNPLPPPNNNKVKVPYTHDNQGFLDHDHKFDLALKVLPSSCLLLNKGSYSSTSFSSVFTHTVVADFDARKSIFYADFDKNNSYNSVLTPTQVNRSLLENAVEEFLKFMKAQK